MKTAIDNHIAKSNYDFSVLYEFPDLDISEHDFYAQIANYKGEIVGAFTITPVGNGIVLSLTRSQINQIPLGEYIWDLKMVKSSQDPLIEGKFIRVFGVTELP